MAAVSRSTRSVPPPPPLADATRSVLDSLPADAPLAEVFRRTCRASARTIDVERVGVWLFIDNGATLRCAELYELSKDAHSSGALLQVADFPSYFASLNILKSVPAKVAANEPWTAELAAEYLAPLGIASMLDAGLFVGETLVGVVCHEHVGEPRQWTSEESAYAAWIAEFVAGRIRGAANRDLRAAFQTYQRRLVEQDKSASLEQFAAGIAHDFKNVLTVFQAYGSLMSKRAELPEDVRQQAREILTAAERGTHLARALMDFARPAAAPPTVLALDQATEEFLPALRTSVGPKHTVSLICDLPLGGVLIEKLMFTRLLANLVVNACEAMPDGGEATIRLSPARRSGARSGSGNYVRLEVSDHGVGMDEATRRRIFEPYFTTKVQGTGLGMALVKQTAERTGGYVRVRSAPGQGTAVRIFFPSIRASAPAATPPTGRHTSSP